MSVLLIEIPQRPRLAAHAGAGDTNDNSAAPWPSEWFHVWSNDGNSVGRSGHAALALLPRADTVMAVLPACDISWHRITLPRTGATRMKAALGGALEEALLEDTEAVHFSVLPAATAGGLQWVATTQRAWLASALAELEKAGLSIDRVLPAAEPTAAAAQGHFSSAAQAAEGDMPTLRLAHPNGVTTLSLAGGLPRALLTRELAEVPPVWTASPAAAAAAERWLGAPVQVRSEAQQLLSRAASAWNLRQFDLVARHRGTRLLRDAARRFFTREWRFVRWGLAALVAVHLVGLNAYAWQQQRELSVKREAMTALLRNAHPQVRTVLDAPLQMQRETETLRAAAGRAGDTDFETLLAAAASAWPDGVAPVQTLRYESGRLALTAPGLVETQVPAMREKLRAIGLNADWSEGRVNVSRWSGNPSNAGGAAR
jgi:general secretion pathway protein L